MTTIYKSVSMDKESKNEVLYKTIVINTRMNLSFYWAESS